MDGGSTDTTCQILEQYGDRFEWISQKDNGQSDAINTGMGKATGDIIAWLNSDDMYTPGAVRAAAIAFANNPQADLVYGDAQWLTLDGQLISKVVTVEPFDRKRLLTISDFICQPATFFRRAAYEAVGGLNPDLHYCMDYDLWLKLTSDKPAIYIRQTLAQIHCNDETKTSSGGQQRLHEIRNMIQKHGGDGLPAYYRIEYAGLLLGELSKCLKRLLLFSCLKHTLVIASQLLNSRVIGTLFSRKLYQVIRSRNHRIKAQQTR